MMRLQINWRSAWAAYTQNNVWESRKTMRRRFSVRESFFHIENWYSIHSLIRNVLKLCGIFWRGQRNAERVQVRHNYIRLQRLPRAFDGFTLLHISDLHADMNEGAMRCLEELLPSLEYDLC